MTNENKNTHTNENEVAVAENHEIVTVREDNNYVVKKEDGKYIRKAKFKEFSSISAETRDEKIWLLNLIENDDETGNGLKDHVGKQIEVADIITRRYDKINEENGELEYGVLTYLITPDKVAYVTSSKTVYFSIMRIMELFGTPKDPEWVNIKVKVGKEKSTNGDIIKIKMVG